MSEYKESIYRNTNIRHTYWESCCAVHKTQLCGRLDHQVNYKSMKVIHMYLKCILSFIHKISNQTWSLIEERMARGSRIKWITCSSYKNSWPCYRGLAHILSTNICSYLLIFDHPIFEELNRPTLTLDLWSHSVRWRPLNLYQHNLIMRPGQ